MQPIT